MGTSLLGWVVVALAGVCFIAAAVALGVRAKASRAPGASTTRATAELLTGLGLLGLAVLLGALGTFLVAWLHPLARAQDDALARFLEAVRANDEATIDAMTADGAELDRAYLLELAGRSDFRRGSSVGDADTFCVRGVYEARHGLTVQLVSERGVWRVAHAAREVPVCEGQLD